MQLIGVSVGATLVGVFAAVAAAWAVVSLRRHYRQPLCTTLFSAGDKDIRGAHPHDKEESEVACPTHTLTHTPPTLLTASLP